MVLSHNNVSVRMGFTWGSAHARPPGACEIAYSPARYCHVTCGQHRVPVLHSPPLPQAITDFQHVTFLASNFLYSPSHRPSSRT